MNNFDWEKYINFYDDLKYIIDNKEDAINHWNNHGKNENRYFFQFNENFHYFNFDWEQYINFYDDLKYIINNKEEAINHWNNHGKNENRYFFEINENFDYFNFDWEKYIQNNKDLKDIKSKKEAFNHWIIYGIKENRLFYKKNINFNSYSFDWEKYKLSYEDLSNIDNKENAIEHYLKYGINENRKLFLNNLTILNKIILIETLKNQELKVDNNINFIFSLTTIPDRFLSNEFDNVILSLYNQIIPPKYIILNLCKKYNRFFIYDEKSFQKKIDFLKKKFNNLIFNFVEDNGPITKILGLNNLMHIIDKNDKIIIIDDDFEYNNILTYMYNLTYSLYNCDCVFIDERNNTYYNNINNINNINNKIIYDNYQNFAYGWLSYSIEYKYINNLYIFYNKQLEINKNIQKHDDLIITLFYKFYKLNACGINLNFNIITALVDINALKNENNAGKFRMDLEKFFLNLYKFDFHYINNNMIYIDNILSRNETESNIIINKHTNSIYSITLNYNKNVDVINFKINNIEYYINLDLLYNFSNRITFFFKLYR